jgi:hypothetical protein
MILFPYLEVEGKGFLIKEEDRAAANVSLGLSLLDLCWQVGTGCGEGEGDGD